MATTHKRGRRTPISACFAAALILLFARTPSFAQNTSEERIKKLESEFENYKKERDSERSEFQKQIAELKQQIAGRAPSDVSQSVDDAIAELAIRVNSLADRQKTSDAAKGQRLAYIDISFDVLTAVGGSKATDNQLDILQAGGHDPNRRGFTLEQAELSFQGAVDPYFRGDSHMVLATNKAGETEVELEEAFLTTTSLPGNLQFKFGQYLTEFGRVNPTHPHTWDFVDQPLVNNRMFGGDGLRAPGARISWLAPTPFYLELTSGIQNARGETVTSFMGNDSVFDPVKGSSGAMIPGSFGGHPFIKDQVSGFGNMLYSERAEASFDLSDASTLLAGLSGLFGPNSTGNKGETEIWGVDWFYKWKPLNNDQGWPFVRVTNEVIWRNAHAAAWNGDLDGDGIAESFGAQNFKDWGTYLQFLWGFSRPWVAGFRVDYVDGNGASTGGDGAIDRRYRLTPDITYYPTEFSKIRLQVNYDKVQQLDDRGFLSVWLQFEILFGAHGAHKF